METRNRIFAIMLVITMILTYMPAMTFAEDLPEGEESPSSETMMTDDEPDSSSNGDVNESDENIQNEDGELLTDPNQIVDSSDEESSETSEQESPDANPVKGKSRPDAADLELTIDVDQPYGYVGTKEIYSFPSWGDEMVADGSTLSCHFSPLYYDGPDFPDTENMVPIFSENDDDTGFVYKGLKENLKEGDNGATIVFSYRDDEGNEYDEDLNGDPYEVTVGVNVLGVKAPPEKITKLELANTVTEYDENDNPVTVDRGPLEGFVGDYNIFDFPVEGDVLYADGTEYTYGEDSEGNPCFVSGYGDRFYPGGLDDPLTAGTNDNCVIDFHYYDVMGSDGEDGELFPLYQFTLDGVQGVTGAESIAYIPFEEEGRAVLYEDGDSDVYVDEFGAASHYYDGWTIFPREGDRFIVNYGDYELTYTCKIAGTYESDGEEYSRYAFINDENDEEELDELIYESDQSEDIEWDPGEHSFTVYYLGASCELPVTIVAGADPYEEESLPNAADLELTIDIDQPYGYVGTNEICGFPSYGDILSADGNTYTCRFSPLNYDGSGFPDEKDYVPIYSKDNDDTGFIYKGLKENLKEGDNGATIVFSYRNDEGNEYAEDSNGNPYEVTLDENVLGVKAPPERITSIDFADTITKYDEDDNPVTVDRGPLKGYAGEYGLHNFPVEGDILYADGIPYRYSLDDGECECFVSEYGDKFYSYDLEDPLVEGNNDNCIIEFSYVDVMGNDWEDYEIFPEYNYRVNNIQGIKDVESISYIPFEDGGRAVLYEDSDSDNGVDEFGRVTHYYSGGALFPRVGDRLLIEFSDHQCTYTCIKEQFTDEDGEYTTEAFVNEETDEVIDRDDLYFYSDQDDDVNWEIGEHSFTIYYLGASCELPVTVVEGESPSGEDEPVDDTHVIQYLSYYDEAGVSRLLAGYEGKYTLENFPEHGDELSVLVRNGGTEEYVRYIAKERDGTIVFASEKEEATDYFVATRLKNKISYEGNEWGSGLMKFTYYENPDSSGRTGYEANINYQIIAKRPDADRLELEIGKEYDEESGEELTKELYGYVGSETIENFPYYDDHIVEGDKSYEIFTDKQEYLPYNGCFILGDLDSTIAAGINEYTLSLTYIDPLGNEYEEDTNGNSYTIVIPVDGLKAPPESIANIILADKVIDYDEEGNPHERDRGGLEGYVGEYSLINFPVVGDQIITNDGTAYVYKNEQEDFISQDGDRFYVYYEGSLTNPLEEGFNTCEIRFGYQDTKGNWPSIDDYTYTIENVQGIFGVKYVRYLPIEGEGTRISIYEGIDGWASRDPDGEIEFVEYDGGYIFPRKGDRFIVVNVDDSVETYTCREVTDEDDFKYNAFVNDANNEEIELRFSSDQSEENRWSIGDHAFQCIFKGRSCELPVTLKKCPITKIEFNPTETSINASEIEQYGSISFDHRGSWTFFKNGDSITVTYDAESGFGDKITHKDTFYYNVTNDENSVGMGIANSEGKYPGFDPYTVKNANDAMDELEDMWNPVLKGKNKLILVSGIEEFMEDSEPIEFEMTVIDDLEDGIWNTPQYELSNDYSKCSAFSHHSGCYNFVKIETVDTIATGTPPTCEEGGMAKFTATFEDPDFGTYETPTEWFDALGHDYQDVPNTGHEATCTEDGKTADQECTRCHDIIQGQELSAYGHDYQEVPNSAHEATCTEDGKTADQECTRCHDVIQGKEVPAYGHDYQEIQNTAYEATCTEQGKAADHECSRCHEVIRGQAISALGHRYMEVPNSAHDATCTEPGKLVDYECTRCHNVIPGETLPAAGHIPGTAVKENENESSYEEVIYCTVCGTELSRTTRSDLEDAKVAANTYLDEKESKLGKYDEEDRAGLKQAIDDARAEISFAENIENINSATNTVETAFRGKKTTAQKQEEARQAEEARRIEEETRKNGIIDPSMPKLSIKGPKKAKKAFTARWKKLNKKKQKLVQGIEVQYTSDPLSLQGAVLRPVGKKKASLKIKGLQPKGTYWVRVRTYKWVGRTKYVSTWTKFKKVKVK